MGFIGLLHTNSLVWCDKGQKTSSETYTTRETDLSGRRDVRHTTEDNREILVRVHHEREILWRGLSVLRGVDEGRDTRRTEILQKIYVYIL